MKEPRRIACFHLNQVGDLLFSLPAIHNLRQRYPEAEITSVARPHLRELIRLSRLVDEIIERPRRPIGAGLKVASALRDKKFDLAFVFSTSFGMSVLAGVSGAPVRVGFDHPMSRLFVTHRVPTERPPSLRHNLKLIEAIGCPVIKTDYAGVLHTGPEEKSQAEQVLESVGFGRDEGFAILSPSTSGRREIKSWSDEGFAQIADNLVRDFGIRSIVVGLNNGCRICDLTSNVVDLNGRTSLPVLAAVLERASVFIGVDSGVMHLASAMQAPVVALFGPTDPEKTGPQGGIHKVVCADVPCRPCLESTCANNRECMESISVEEVSTAVYSLLERQPQHASMA